MFADDRIPDRRPRSPNEGVRVRLIVGLGAGIGLGALIWLGTASYRDVLPGRLSAMALGVYVALYTGLAVGLAHYLMRALISLWGWAPWSYVRFLDYAADRLLLRKKGTGYIFVHRLLLEHFAAKRYSDNESDADLRDLASRAN
jgi:hypothetical protein